MLLNKVNRRCSIYETSVFSFSVIVLMVYISQCFFFSYNHVEMSFETEFEKFHFFENEVKCTAPK